MIMIVSYAYCTTRNSFVCERSFVCESCECGGGMLMIAEDHSLLIMR
jgi:hypothetical protein